VVAWWGEVDGAFGNMCMKGAGTVPLRSGDMR
jgi:hypothetical protein